VNTELSQSFFRGLVLCGFLRVPSSTTNAIPIYHGLNDLPIGYSNHTTKTQTQPTLTQIGVVLLPCTALSVYTHSGDFDSFCRHWLNSPRCPTLPAEYCPGGGEAHFGLDASVGVLTEC